MKSNIFITGFSGTGKTTVGQEAARRLGWRYVDTDDVIVEDAGKAIERIFADEGEARFRQLEHEALVKVAQGDTQVVSTGGGIIMDARNREVMERSGVIVCLDARPETIYERLVKQGLDEHAQIVRPMLEAENPLERIRSLKEARQFNYTLAHWTVNTDFLTPAETAEEVIRGWKMVSQKSADAAANAHGDLAAVVKTSSGDYPVWVGYGILDELGERVKSILKPPVAYVVTDEGVYSQARRAQRALEAAGIPAHMFIMPSGEQSKNLEIVQKVYQWLAERKAERGHMIVAVGGGVVGDLAGFVAASYLRGMPFAQVPTTLLSMMDAAIGGKVAVDLPQGKNLVGAFYQPKFVLSDVQTLETLPIRELTSGWAEAIKHGLITDKELLSDFESNSESIMSLERDVATDIIRRSVAIKANVVSQDERETLGIRILLNYGHTIGHAIEAATSYGVYLHGEAVSIGMMAAARIGQGMGMMSADEVERQRNVLHAYGLPLTCAGVDPDAINLAMRSDKKVASGTIRWVLLDGIGNAVTRNDVPAELVQEAIESVVA